MLTLPASSLIADQTPERSTACVSSRSKNLNHPRCFLISYEVFKSYADRFYHRKRLPRIVGALVAALLAACALAPFAEAVADALGAA